MAFLHKKTPNATGACLPCAERYALKGVRYLAEETFWFAECSHVRDQLGVEPGGSCPYWQVSLIIVPVAHSTGAVAKISSSNSVPSA